MNFHFCFLYVSFVISILFHHSFSYVAAQRLIFNVYVSFTFIPLADRLFKKGMQIVSTLCLNKKGNPKAMKKAKLMRNESFFKRQRYLIIQKWRDKREIYMISMRYNGSSILRFLTVIFMDLRSL